MSKKIITKEDYHESADRLSIIQQILEDYVKKHPACKADKSIQKSIDEAQEILGDVYQKLAEKMF